MSLSSSRHSGEGIFFTSRIFDFFQITSINYCFTKDLPSDSWKIDSLDKAKKGTEIILRINNQSKNQINDLFLKYVKGDNFEFSKTDVRIELAEFGGVYLVSRSQAKRIYARLENFSEVMFDFKNVEKISPTFADELFRVTKELFPNLKVYYCNAGPVVEIFIKKALGKLIY